MGSKFLKPGKVVIVLKGRYAGRKAVIVQVNENGTKDRKYPHAILVGISKYPLRNTRSMGKKKQAKRSSIKAFAKAVNLQHFMPTRYTFDVEAVKKIVADSKALRASKRRHVEGEVKKLLQDKYNAGKSKWFFTKLRF